MDINMSKIEFVEGNRNCVYLHYNGHLYTKSNGNYWKCRHKDCERLIKLENNQISNEPTHPSHFEVTLLEIECLKAIKRMKVESASDMNTNIRIIYGRNIKILKDKGYKSVEISEYINEYSKFRGTLNKCRGKVKLLEPQLHDTLNKSRGKNKEKITKTQEKEYFLKAETGKKPREELEESEGLLDNSNKRICIQHSTSSSSKSSQGNKSCFSFSESYKQYSDICAVYTLRTMTGLPMEFLEKSIQFGFVYEIFSITHEKRDIEPARLHFKNQLNNFIINSSKGKSLDDLGFDLINASSKRLLMYQPVFSCGKPDVILVPTVGSATPLEYCCVCFEIKPSNQIKDLNGQSLWQLISASMSSENPVLHITTDLDSTFKAIILTNISEKNSIITWDLTGDETISLIIYWVENMCIKYNKDYDQVKPNKSSVPFLNKVQIAKDHIKKIAMELNGKDKDKWPNNLLKLDPTHHCKDWVNSQNFC